MSPLRNGLLSVGDLDLDGIGNIMKLSAVFSEVLGRDIPKVPALRGKTMAMVFSEDSTRTRTSFEIAAKKLSMDILSLNSSQSSIKKGESLKDTLANLHAIGADCFVIRHSSAGVPAQASTWLPVPIVNAGDGCHEHPTQALLDCYTLIKELNDSGDSADDDQILKCFNGLAVTIVGDVEHSRVARSLVKMLDMLGAVTTLCGPKTLMPKYVDKWPVRVRYRLDEVLPETQVCYVLRLQNERGSGIYLSSMREYAMNWGIDHRRDALLPDNAVIMHPGPVNRGVELASDIADSTRSLILDQASNGVAVRMAVIYMLLANSGDVTFDKGAFDKGNLVSMRYADRETNEQV